MEKQQRLRILVPAWVEQRICSHWTQTLLLVFLNIMVSSLFPLKWSFLRLAPSLGYTLFPSLTSLTSHAPFHPSALCPSCLNLPLQVSFCGLSDHVPHFLLLSVLACHFVANKNNLPLLKGRRSCAFVFFHLSTSRHARFPIPIYSFPSPLCWLLSLFHWRRKAPSLLNSLMGYVE